MKRAKQIFLILLVLVLFLTLLSVAKAKGFFLPQPMPPVLIDGDVDLSSLTLEQKIAQMAVVHGSSENRELWQRLQLGGIHLFALENKDLYIRLIQEYQKGMLIPFFVTADLEGCINPFANFQSFPAASSITTDGASYEKGAAEGTFLRELGVTLNFAPVVDLKDTLWKCRTFPGDEQQIAERGLAYISGVQNQGILAVAKHYPGKTLVVRDPHKFLVAATLDEKDVYPFQQVAGLASGIMVSHVISSGAVDSAGVPAVVSPAVIAGLREQFPGLIISDEINMLGLKEFYPSQDALYVAVFAAGNDLVLNFNDDPLEISHMIEVVAEAVRKGVIPEEQIDASVRRILKAKGMV